MRSAQGAKLMQHGCDHRVGFLVGAYQGAHNLGLQGEFFPPGRFQGTHASTLLTP